MVLYFSKVSVFTMCLSWQHNSQCTLSVFTYMKLLNKLNDVHEIVY